MTIKLTDAATYTKGYTHQNDAWDYLQSNIPTKVLEEFARRFRNQQPVTSVDTVPISGINLIKQFEGCKLNAYYDPHTGGLPITIGWGSTRNFDGQPFKITDKITQKQADELLLHQLTTQFLPKLQQIPYWNEMNDNQRGALLSFAYNLGPSFYGGLNFNTITTRLRNKEWNLIPDALYRYRNPGSNVEAGLARRRKAEGELWKIPT